MEQKIHKAKLLIKDNKIKRDGDIWSVGDEIVKLVKKPGRSFLTCTCFNYVNFCSENPLCYHKLSVLLFEASKGFHKRIDKVIKLYENCENINMKPENEVIIQELKDLKYTK